MSSYRKKGGRGTYTGTAYRGGRQSGRKNLIKTEGGVINEHGVAFTMEEKKALEQRVNTANRKRARMLEMEAKLPRRVYGVDTGGTMKDLQTMGRESDFILSPKSKSLQRFKSRADFESYMRNLERVNQRDYISERVALYKENHIKAIERELGGIEGSEDLVEKIRGMSDKEYMERVMSEEESLEIQYIYGNDKKTEKLNMIRQALGMDLVEDPIPDELE